MQGLTDHTSGDIEDASASLPLGHKAVSPASTRQGWQCPACRRVNAPFISACPCTAASSHGIDLRDLNRSVDNRVPTFNTKPRGTQ